MSRSLRAVLRTPQTGWFHVTKPKHLPSIRAKGLLVKPPERTYGEGSGADRTLGGIYLAPAKRIESVIDMLCADLGGGESVAVLSVTVPAGTRYCLDEDEIARLSMWDKKKLGKMFGADLVAEVERDCFPCGVVYDCARAKLNRWSCLLAQALDEKHLSLFNIRVFDPPVVTGERIDPCTPPGRSGGAVVTMWHGTPAGGFSSFKGPTFFAPNVAQAMTYTRRGVGAAQATPKGHRGEPELIEARVRPGKVFDLSTDQGKEDLARVFKDPAFVAEERATRAADPDYFTPSLRSVLESSWTVRGYDRVQALPYNLARWLGPYLARIGYDSVLVGEASFESLYVLHPDRHVQIVGRTRL